MALVTCGGCGLKFDRGAEEAEFIQRKMVSFRLRANQKR